MSAENSNDPGRTSGSTPDARRRRILQGGLAGAPALMTLVSPNALAATQCVTGSAFGSINASRPDAAVACAGRSPGYWRQPVKFSEWPNGYIPSAEPVMRANGTVIYTPPQGSSTKATTFGSLFSGAGSYSTLTLLECLQFGNAESPNSLDRSEAAFVRHITAALLNAAAQLVPVDIMSVGTVKTIWSKYKATGNYEPTPGTKWNAEQITIWLRQTMV
jgi:hypothetical protein